MQSLSTKLTQVDDGEYHHAWKTFLFNIPAVKTVTTEIADNVELANEILRAGQAWSGSGCTTGYCSKTLFGATGVTLVSAQFADYIGAFLYSLCLHWSLEVLQLDLPDKAAEAAFALSQAYGGVAGRSSSRPQVERMAVDEDDTGEQG